MWWVEQRRWCHHQGIWIEDYRQQHPGREAEAAGGEGPSRFHFSPAASAADALSTHTDAPRDPRVPVRQEREPQGKIPPFLLARLG